MEGDDNVPVLRAYLNPVDGDPVEANVNLAECIGNDNGTLVYGEFICHVCRCRLTSLTSSSSVKYTMCSEGNP